MERGCVAVIGIQTLRAWPTGTAESAAWPRTESRANARCAASPARCLLSATTMTDTTAARLPPAYHSWLRTQGVAHAGVRFCAAPGRGTYGVASTDVGAGSVVLTVPKSAMLTVRNSPHADALESLLEMGMPPPEVLALALALERRAGAKSRWAPYVDSLPRDAPLPLLWSAAELRHLAGTGLDATSRRRRARLAANYRAAAAEWAGGELPPLDAVLRASTLVSSRAFDVDSAHGVGLLPLIDALNHKPALAPAHGGEAGDDDDSEDDDDDALRRDCAIRIPPAEESDDDDDDDEDDDCALIETLRPLRAGEELCLTYGNYGNYELLAGYGFTLDDNPFETALLCWEHVVAAAEAVLGARDARRRLAELRAEGAAAVGRPFVFDRRATAPPELVGLLRRLTDDAKSRDAILKRAVKAQVAGYGGAVAGQKRRRTAGGDDAAAHAARLVRGELEIWEAAAGGGRALEGREADAAEAAAAARRLRVD